jgi:hypothetical protein
VGYLRVDTGSERGGSGERSVELLEVLDVESSIRLGDFGTEDFVEELSDTSLAENKVKKRNVSTSRARRRRRETHLFEAVPYLAVARGLAMALAMWTEYPEASNIPQLQKEENRVSIVCCKRNRR